MFHSKHMKCQIFAYICGFVLLLNVNEILGATSADSWLIFAKETKKVLNKCYRNHTYWSDSWKCFKRNSLVLFDDVVAADTIPLSNTLELIRKPGAFEKRYENQYDEELSEDFNWTDEMMDRIGFAISTHNARFVVQPEVNEARRRHRMRMMPAMIFGMAVLGVIIIPIGFHIMTVIGGIALLFGKMALLLAVINSSKRLVPPGVHYGSYQDHYYGHWDRNHEPPPPPPTPETFRY